MIKPPGVVDGKIQPFHQMDWRGWRYDVGDIVIYPRALYGRSVEVAEARVLSIDIVPKWNNGNPIWVGAVKLQPLQYTWHRWHGDKEHRPVIIRNFENITVVPQ